MRSTFRKPLASAVVTVFMVIATACAGVPQPVAEVDFTKAIRPLIAKYCGDCHGADAPEAELSLTSFASKQAVLDERAAWSKVLKQLTAESMPPTDSDQPSPAERKLLTDWVDFAIHYVDCDGYVTPGRVTLRRLNRTEYRNTVRDLLDVDYEPAAEFPGDDVGYGFDNIGDVLSLPPLLMEKYLAAAEQISAAAMRGQFGKDVKHVVALKAERRQAEGRKLIRRLVSRAYRRPAADGEIDRLLQRIKTGIDDGASVEQSVEFVLQAVLVSPYFLFRVEQDPTGTQRERTLSDYELATRLAYFLWNSMPDDDLFALARAGTLRDDRILREQVQRMLADPKSDSFLTTFVDQWLQLRNLDDMEFDTRRYPGCDRDLLAAMRTETELFFSSVVRGDASILRFLDADYTFANARLAKHYGIRGVTGNEFRRVSLQGTRRSGVLTQAAILTVTSNPTRTSPVKRGKFVLDNVLGAPPPPPPANVPLLDAAGRKLTGTLRQRMTQHRSDPACAACHKVMDPIGFAMENFDAVGRWRERDEGLPIDAKGELPDGTTFDGPNQLLNVLKTAKRDAFVQCVTEKLLTYALGRGLEYYDQCAVDQILANAKADNYRFSTLILEIASSTPFQKRGRK